MKLETLVMVLLSSVLLAIYWKRYRRRLRRWLGGFKAQLPRRILHIEPVDNSEGLSEYRFADIQNPNPKGIFIFDHDLGT